MENDSSAIAIAPANAVSFRDCSVYTRNRGALVLNVGIESTPSGPLGIIAWDSGMPNVNLA